MLSSWSLEISKEVSEVLQRVNIINYNNYEVLVKNKEEEVDMSPLLRMVFSIMVCLDIQY